MVKNHEVFTDFIRFKPAYFVLCT